MPDADTLTLTDFLMARIAEDEDAAKRSMPGPWRRVDGEEVSGVNVLANNGAGPWIAKLIPLGYDVTRAHAAHIARHDPARVLAECEARRRIVADARDFIPTEGSMAEAVLLHLVAVYADHPDYRDEWR